MNTLASPKAWVNQNVVFQDYMGTVGQGTILSAYVKQLRAEDSTTPAIYGWVYEIRVGREGLQSSIEEKDILIIQNVSIQQD